MAAKRAPSIRAMVARLAEQGVPCRVTFPDGTILQTLVGDDSYVEEAPVLSVFGKRRDREEECPVFPVRYQKTKR